MNLSKLSSVITQDLSTSSEIRNALIQMVKQFVRPGMFAFVCEYWMTLFSNYLSRWFGSESDRQRSGW
jgi:hypothetical protein